MERRFVAAAAQKIGACGACCLSYYYVVVHSHNKCQHQEQHNCCPILWRFGCSVSVQEMLPLPQSQSYMVLLDAGCCSTEFVGSPGVGRLMLMFEWLESE
jgi:hypothetical protein